MSTDPDQQTEGGLADKFITLLGVGMITIIVILSDERVIGGLGFAAMAGVFIHELGLIPALKFIGGMVALLVGIVVVIAAIGGVALLIAPRAGYEFESIQGE